jgi:hypothetical protein
VSFVSRGIKIGQDGYGGHTYLTKSEAKHVIAIARRHGCKRVGFPSSLNGGGKVFANMRFSSMGKKR